MAQILVRTASWADSSLVKKRHDVNGIPLGYPTWGVDHRTRARVGKPPVP
jgi:hypothetical protein